MKQHRIGLTATLAMIYFVSLINYPLSGATKQEPRQSERITQVLLKYVDNKTVSGAVGLVADRDSIKYFEAVGFADIEGKQKMRRDSLFWIASMTKPITAVAVMMRQDEGKLSINDPVEKYLPEFKNQWMIEEKTAEKITLVKPPRPITLRDLLTHTSGLSDVPPPRADCSLAELVMAYSQQPLKFPPGSRWEYSNAGINTLGRIVEVVSSEAFATFLEKRIFKPLGMKDTTFWPTKSQAARLAKSYEPATDGSGLKQTDIFFLKGDLLSRSRTPFPAGGLSRGYMQVLPDDARQRHLQRGTNPLA